MFGQLNFLHDVGRTDFIQQFIVLLIVKDLDHSTASFPPDLFSPSSSLFSSPDRTGVFTAFFILVKTLAVFPSLTPPSSPVLPHQPSPLPLPPLRKKNKTNYAGVSCAFEEPVGPTADSLSHSLDVGERDWAGDVPRAGRRQIITRTRSMPDREEERSMSSRGSTATATATNANHSYHGLEKRPPARDLTSFLATTGLGGIYDSVFADSGLDYQVFSGY